MLKILPRRQDGQNGMRYYHLRDEFAQTTMNDTAHALVKTPAAVYVEQVYPTGDFNLLGIN